MKRLAILILAATVLVVLPAGAFAHNPGAGPGPYGCGGAGSYGYHMGPGMMWGYGPGYGMGPGMMRGYGQSGAANPESQLTEDQAKGLAQQYADQYLKGFTVDKVLPFGTPGGTAYSVEMKGPKDEIRVLHINPWGNVMPFGGPRRRAG